MKVAEWEGSFGSRTWFRSYGNEFYRLCVESLNWYRITSFQNVPITVRLELADPWIRGHPRIYRLLESWVYNPDSFPWPGYFSGREVITYVAAIANKRLENQSTSISSAPMESNVSQRKLIIVGNPPYQMKDGGHSASAVPIYHKFVETCIDELHPDKLCMIVPSRWMAGGRGLDDFRARMSKDRRMKMIRHFGQEQQIFESVRVSGGVNYFLWDSQHNGDCDFNGVPCKLDQFDIIVRNSKHIPVIQKVMATHKGDFMNRIVSPSKPFGVRANHKNWVAAQTRYPGILGRYPRQPHEINRESQKNMTAVKCYVRPSQVQYLPASAITQKAWMGYGHLWKVCVPGLRNEGSDPGPLPWRILGTPFVIEPYTVCVETYLVVDAFETEQECENLITYMKTRFFRYMLYMRCISQHLWRETYSWVPSLSQVPPSGWVKIFPKPWTDDELIEMFGLTDDEVDDMNKTIRAW